MRLLGISALGLFSALVSASACSSAGGSSGTAGGAATGGAGAGGTGNSGGIVIGGSGGIDVDGGGNGGTGGGFVGDPKTCAEAELAKTYIGCDFWPTVVANNVWSIFDYAVVVANAGEAVADVTIERGGQQWKGQVQPNGLEKFFLPWVPELKGPDADANGGAKPLSTSVRATGGAYHLTTTVPVTVYQFNALEYKGQGGPPGKSWLGCPGNTSGIGCFSFSNDASLLLPTTALTTNYRVTGQPGWPVASIGPYFAVTGTVDGTVVTVLNGLGTTIMAGADIPQTGPGAVLTFNIDKGEVVELVGSPSSDMSGTLVQSQAGKPIQVIAGIPCIQSPIGTQACDHTEESVFPAETWGKRYFVVPPTGPLGNAPGHVVRIYGNVDDTALQYPTGAPANAPATIGAGQVVDLGVVSQPFEILGDKEFAVGMFQLGAGKVDPMTPAPNQKGDPAQSLATAVEQFRTKYVFLAPDDYDVSYVDIVMPDDAVVVLDGSSISATPQSLGSGYSIVRQKLSGGVAGAHLLQVQNGKAVGIQVVGYGSYTSYQYPGGLNLTLIAPPPPPIK